MDRSTLKKFICNTIEISDMQAEQIAEQFQFVQIEPATFFLKQGKINNEYLFLESGFMRSFVHDVDGNEVTLNFYSNNAIVFDVGSLFQRKPSEETIEVLIKCEGWKLTFDELNALFHGRPEFREFGRAVLVKGFIAFKERTLSLINKTAEQRYEELINTKPEIFKFAPLKYIASYLGVTDTSLSRIRREYVKK